MRSFVLASTIALFAMPAFAQDTTVKMYEALETGQGKEMGTVTVSQSADGLSFKADLNGMPGGEHGFHVHEKGSCAPAEQDGKMVPAQAAGGHYDPEGSKHHMGPEGHGHMGDLPLLKADADGKVSETVVAPRLKSLDEIKGRALMVHIGGDNYADQPKPLGGGGARIVCGVIE
ncbi:superoxide dismutase family protein [Brucella pituitosa]|uniref:Superoxide dismutase [Cu-Zn] n=1 Tax=Brucella pituitosa TaxID=571256 RepID=A0A643EYX8_9HYPH|nr:superoxide dismutase family protein [Brucella pituitosa]KAB0570934.1 superoxide dismutase [Cu-Zn] SodC2 [Brucella pituitosa]